MSFKDWVQYVVERMVRYVETPKQAQTSMQKENWSYRWFGILPVSCRMFVTKQSQRWQTVKRAKLKNK